MDQDEILVGRFKKGDEKAFDELFHRHKDVVYNLVLRTVGRAEAEDVMQETFIRIYRSLPRFRGNSSFRTWAFRITINCCRDFMRKRGRRPSTVWYDPANASDLSDPACEVSDRWTRRELEEAINDLPDRDRQMVILHYREDLSYREISQVLCCPSGTVKARMHFAIARIRRRLLSSPDEVIEL